MNCGRSLKEGGSGEGYSLMTNENPESDSFNSRSKMTASGAKNRCCSSSRS